MIIMQSNAFTCNRLRLALMFIIGIGITCTSHSPAARLDQQWKVHDKDRPQPTVIDPGTASSQDHPGQPPSDAIVLFDGKDLSQWRSQNGGPMKWRVVNGSMEVISYAVFCLKKKRSTQFQ